MGRPEKRDVSKLPNLLQHYHENFDSISSSLRRLLVLDYDGTLTDIVDDPAAAVLSKERHVTLVSLAKRDRTAVWIISGRDRDFLVSQFGHAPSPVGLVAEHGAAVRMPHTKGWQQTDLASDLAWIDQVQGIISEHVKMIPRTWIERKVSTIAWHWRGNQEAGAAIAPTLRDMILSESQRWNAKLQVIEGKCVLEVRLAGITKGRNLQQIMGGSWASPEPGMLLCAGDDTTDEDMFRAIREAETPAANDFSVRVLGQDKTSQTTYASYWVANPAELWEFIDSIGRADTAGTSVPVNVSIGVPGE